LALLASVWAAPAAAQWPGDPPPPVTIPKLRTEGAAPESFLPIGWKIEAIERGPIDGDADDDVVMVIKDTKPINLVEIEWSDTSYDSNPRMLVVLLGKADGFKLGEQNATLIPRLANMNQEDLFDALSLENRVIRIDMHEAFEAGGFEMGSKAFTLRWERGHLVVIGYDKDTTVHNTGETMTLSINYLTGRMLIAAGSMDDVSTPTKTVKVPRQPLLTLDEIGDGLMFNPVPR